MVIYEKEEERERDRGREGWVLPFVCLLLYGRSGHVKAVMSALTCMTDKSRGFDNMTCMVHNKDVDIDKQQGT